VATELALDPRALPPPPRPLLLLLSLPRQQLQPPRRNKFCRSRAVLVHRPLPLIMLRFPIFPFRAHTLKLSLTMS